LYLGAFDADPTTDNSGGTLVVGAIYFNYVAGLWKAWSGTQWKIAAVPSDAAVQSFNGRTGAVSFESGDATATQITVTPSGGITTTNVQASLQLLDARTSAIIDPVAAAFIFGGA
jgi:hypothetical protein